jgi:4-amino-4-deoxy-L-arabinose transferase-like glycosyltransferase
MDLVFNMDRRGQAALYILLILCIAGYFWTAVSIIMFPYSVDYGEAALLDQSRRILSHQALYKVELSDPPYVISNYPPIFPVFQAGLSNLSGLSFLLCGRLISFFASLLSAIILASLARSITGNWLSSFFALGLFLGHPYVITWSALARVDSLALLFCLAALLILYHRWQSWTWLILSCFLLLAAIFTRQSYLLAGPLAALAWLWSRDRRRGIVFSLFLLISSLVVFLGINIQTQGGFYINIVQANLNQYQFSRLAVMGEQLLLIWPVIIFVSFLYAAYVLTKVGQPAFPQINPFVTSGLWFFSIGAVISAVTVGKEGSDVNYFLELIAACSLWVALVAHKILSQNPIRRGIYYLIIGCQLIWLLAGILIFYRSTIGNRWARLDWYRELAAEVQNTAPQGQILSDDYLGMVVQAGQPIYYQPFEYGQLYLAGIWDPEPLAQEIKSGLFPLIIIGGNTLEKPCCWPPELIQAIREAYQIEYRSGLVFCTPLP